MKIETKPIVELIPAEYNPRQDLQPGNAVYEKLKRSIQEFGYVEPIILNERTGIVVGGHQRLKVLKDLGYNEVECVIVDFTEQQEKTLNIALNKITGRWDREKLSELIDSLELEDVDISLTGFDIGELPDMELEREHVYYGDEMERTLNKYRLDFYDSEQAVGYYGFPKVRACHVIPDDLIGFNYVKSWQGDTTGLGVHFFIDDYQFERLWSNPFENIDRLRRFECVLSPDFSTYRDMPMAMRIWNLYRIYMMTQIMQNEGLEVIPILRDLGPGTYDWTLEPIEPGGVVAVSTIGHVRAKAEHEIFQEDINEYIRILKPECLIIYGKPIECDFGSVPVKYIDNKVFK